MDIRSRKSRIINLKKKKMAIKNPSTLIKIHIDDPIVSESKPFEGGTFPCIQCGAKEAIELGRCRPCDVEHQKIVTRLDAIPRQVVEKVPPKLTYRKEVSKGVVVTISTTEPLRI